ncbi:MAG: hypothetical protein LBT21_04325 [Oscillospiraceae bacterium]|jgi:hypothetical protein|nr:hypothetical protein [Oscillospiraceae bacterium]
MTISDWREFFINISAEYCRNHGLSEDKLRHQRVSWSKEGAVFGDPSSNTVKPEGLTNDLDTLPAATLLVEITPKGIVFEETPHTRTYLAA